MNGNVCLIQNYGDRKLLRVNSADGDVKIIIGPLVYQSKSEVVTRPKIHGQHAVKPGFSQPNVYSDTLSDLRICAAARSAGPCKGPQSPNCNNPDE